MSLSTPLLRWLTLLSPVCCCLFAARGILHYFQLESYQFPGYFRSLKRNRVHSLLPGLCATAAVLVLLYGFDVLAPARRCPVGRNSCGRAAAPPVGRSRACDRQGLFPRAAPKRNS